MKRTGKLLAALLVVFALLMSMTALTVSAAKTTEDTTIYLTPNANWKQDNARFALYTWDGGDKWFDMTDADKDGVYECTIPAGIENIIFCRMNPNASANNWNNKWNQTADLKYNGTSNHYIVKEGTWDSGGGTWATFNSTCLHTNLGPEATCTTPQVCNDCGDPVVAALGHSYNTAHLCTRCNTQAPFTVAGSGAHLGTEWDTGNTANDMTYADGVYTKVYENVAAGSYAFKVVRDHDWGTAYPSQDKTYTVDKAGSTVTITLTGTSVKVTIEDPVCTHENLGPEATCTTSQTCLDCGAVIVPAGHTYNANHLCTRCNEQATFTVAGSGEHLGAGKEWWDATNEENNMTFADGVYTKVYENVAAGEYALKVVRNHDWSVAYPESDKSYTVDANGSKVTVTLTGTTVEVKVEAPHQHVFVDGKCECEAIDPTYVEGYYLVGWINGADYGCEGDYANLGEYRFVDGKLTVKFNQDSYVFVKSANLNGESIGWFLSETYETDKDATLAAGKSEKLWLPGNIDIALTLTVNEDGTLTLVADYHVHAHEKVVTAPTCTEGGYTTYTCECGDTYTADEVAALGHDMVVDTAVAPTCTETGLNEGSHCSRCDHKVAQEVVPALGHSFGEWIVDTEPTEEADGAKHRVCGTCGETETGVVPSLGHTHNYNSEVTTAPTCDAEGVKTFTCRCGDTYTEAVAALGHDMVVDAAVAPTCTETGLTEGSHCTRCDHKVAQEVVPALGHEFDTYKSLCSVCYAPNPDFIVNTIDVTKENKLICNKYHLVGDLGPYEFITFKIENAGHYKFVGTGLAFTIYTTSTDAPGADFTAGTGTSWSLYVFTEADLEPGEYWVGIIFLAGEGEYNVTVEYTAPHSHNFVDGKCECGEEDPNYVPPHEHEFVNGKCECGAEDPDYVAPEQPDDEKPEEPQPAPSFFERVWATIVNFFNSIRDFFTNLFKTKK